MTSTTIHVNFVRVDDSRYRLERFRDALKQPPSVRKFDMLPDECVLIEEHVADLGVYLADLATIDPHMFSRFELKADAGGWQLSAELFDEFTGHVGRIAWTIHRDRDGMHSFRIQRGVKAVSLRGLQSLRGALVGYGFSTPDPENRHEAEELALAYQAAARHRGQFSIVAESMIVNSDLVFVPTLGIGSIGMLVRRRDYKVALLGSAHPIDLCVWAYYRGFVEFEEEKVEIALVIDIIVDRKRSTEVLCLLFHGRNFWANIDPRLDDLPCRLEVEMDSTWRAWHDLREADLRGWMRFHVERRVPNPQLECE